MPAEGDKPEDPEGGILLESLIGINLAYYSNIMTLRFRQSSRGFTLIELLIVVAIIGIITAIAVPNLLNAINKGRQKRTMGDLRAVGSGLSIYQSDHRFYPVVNDGTAADLKDYLTMYIGNFSDLDGWATPIVYQSNGLEYTLISFGKNRLQDLPYTSGITHEFETDIVFVGGSFSQWPEGSQH
jgi:general secretion pathway protein G